MLRGQIIVFRNTLNLVLGIIIMTSLASCATVDVPSRNQLLSRNDLTQKECYSYDTQKENFERNIRTALPLGIVSLILGPIGPIVAGVGSGVAMQVDQKVLPTKCGLTVDDAIKEASAAAFLKDSTAVWRRLREDGSLTVKVTPLYPREACSVQSLEITKEPKGGQSKRYSERIEACKDKNGTPIIAQYPSRQEEDPRLYAKEAPVVNSPGTQGSPPR